MHQVWFLIENIVTENKNVFLRVLSSSESETNVFGGKVSPLGMMELSRIFVIRFELNIDIRIFNGADSPKCLRFCLIRRRFEVY